MTLYATNPAYFRGFTLIALKEGQNGEKEDDYAGNFQVGNVYFRKPCMKVLYGEKLAVFIVNMKTKVKSADV